MAVTNGPQIALRSDIGAEVGLGASSDVNLNNADIRDLIGKASGAQNAMSEYYGASADNSLSSYTHDDSLYVFGATQFSPATDANIGKTDPTNNGQTMYWNRGDQPFDGTVDGSFASQGTDNTGILYRRFNSSDNQGTVRSSGFGSSSFGIYQGTDYAIKSTGSAVWCFPWQKITKAAHTFSGNYYQTTAGYPSNDYNEMVLYLVEFDTWTLDGSDPTRGILSNQVARTQIFGSGITYPTQRTNWAGQTWSYNKTTVGRYLCLELQLYCSPQHYTQHYMSCSVS